MFPSIIRTTLLLVAVVVITGCQFVGDNRHNVPLGQATIERLAEIGSSPSEPMVVRVYSPAGDERGVVGRRSGPDIGPGQMGIG